MNLFELEANTNNKYIDWNTFKAPLDKAFNEEAKGKDKGGRPSFNKL